MSSPEKTRKVLCSLVLLLAGLGCSSAWARLDGLVGLNRSSLDHGHYTGPVAGLGWSSALSGTALEIGLGLEYVTRGQKRFFRHREMPAGEYSFVGNGELKIPGVDALGTLAYPLAMGDWTLRPYGGAGVAMFFGETFTPGDPVMVEGHVPVRADYETIWVAGLRLEYRRGLLDLRTSDSFDGGLTFLPSFRVALGWRLR